MPNIQLPKQLHPGFGRPNIKPSGPIAIDKSNPLSQNLIFCGVVVPTGLHELVSNKHYLLPNAVIRPGFDGGFVAEYNGVDTDDFGIDPIHITAGGAQSLASGSILERVAKTNPRGDSWMIYRDNVDTDDWLSYTFNYNNSKMSVRFKNDHNAVSVIDPTIPALGTRLIGSGTFHNIRGVNTIQTEGYVDGRYDEQTLILYGSVDFTFMDRIKLGGTHTYEGEPAIGLMCVWDEVMSLEKHLVWQADPYQILRPAVPMQYFTASAAPPAVTAKPWGAHALDRQYAAIAAHRLGGILQ